MADTHTAWGWLSFLSKGVFMWVARAHADLWKCWVASLSQEGIKGNPGGENARTRRVRKAWEGREGEGRQRRCLLRA